MPVDGLGADWIGTYSIFDVCCGGCRICLAVEFVVVGVRRGLPNRIIRVAIESWP